MFKALVLEKSPEFSAAVREVDDGFLPPGDVTFDVDHSTLNYKDALAITNRSPVVREWPMVAGIDGAGTVRESRHPAWRPGDRVVLNGHGVGEIHKGCLAGRQAGWSLAATVPAPSMPATMGHVRTTGDRFVMARPSLKFSVECAMSTVTPPPSANVGRKVSSTSRTAAEKSGDFSSTRALNMRTPRETSDRPRIPNQGPFASPERRRGSFAP